MRKLIKGIPLISWLFGAAVAVVMEQGLGDPLTELLRLPKIPVLFGFVIMLKKPEIKSRQKQSMTSTKLRSG